MHMNIYEQTQYCIRYYNYDNSGWRITMYASISSIAYVCIGYYHLSILQLEL